MESEDGENSFNGWKVLLLSYLIVWGAIALVALQAGCETIRDEYRRGARLAAATSTGVAIVLVHWVIFAFWPIYLVLAIFPPLRGRMRDFRDGRSSSQTGQTMDMPMVSSTGDCSWSRRGWLVLLRARHQRTTASRMIPWWRWTGCCCKRDSTDDMLIGAPPPPREKHDIEGGQGSVVHNTAVPEFRQLLTWVVEYEEDGVFRSIVGYL